MTLAAVVTSVTSQFRTRVQGVTNFDLVAPLQRESHNDFGKVAVKPPGGQTVNISKDKCSSSLNSPSSLACFYVAMESMTDALSSGAVLKKPPGDKSSLVVLLHK